MACVYDKDDLIGIFTDNNKDVYISNKDGKMYVWVDEDKQYTLALNVPNKDSGYTPPKGGGRHWDKEKKGWIDSDGNVWVKDKSAHGGEHWDVQYPNGGYDNVYPDGTVRPGKGGRGKFSPSVINVSSENVKVVNNAGTSGAIVVGAIVVYQGVKWIVATITAAPTGGASLGLAILTP